MTHPFPLFEPIWSPSREVLVTPEITSAFEAGAAVAIGVSGGKDSAVTRPGDYRLPGGSRGTAEDSILNCPDRLAPNDVSGVFRDLQVDLPGPLQSGGEVEEVGEDGLLYRKLVDLGSAHHFPGVA